MKHNVDTIHFYHTNDVHSHFDSWPQISRFLTGKKDEHIAGGAACYLFDIGDHVDRSHPYTEGTEGKGNVLLLNEANYDAVTIGNNEGITMSKQALEELYEEANFDVILGNLFEMNGKRPEWAVPYKIYLTKKGTRIGVIGATALYTEFYSKLGWKITSPRTKLKEIAESILEKTDMIICLSHMGIVEDELLASECKVIDVILGAHTHHLFHEGKLVEETLLAATGKFGAFVGHVTLQFDTNTKTIIDRSAVLYPTETLQSERGDAQKVSDLIAAGNAAMEERAFYNPSPLLQNLLASGTLSSFFGRALIAHTGADCAIFNAGIFLKSLDAGWVTRGDLHACLPHPINPCIITLDGSELLNIYKLSLNEEWPQIKIKGLGFRGTLMGAMIYSRLHMNQDEQLIAGNRKVVPGEKYTLATLDMFTFGFFFPSLKNAEKEYLMPELIRDVVALYGRKYFKE